MGVGANVTGQREPEAIRARPGASSGRRDGLFLASVGFVGLAIAIVGGLSVAQDRAEAGQALPLWEPMVWEASSVLVLLLLTPAIQILTRRLTPLEAPWPRTLAGHMAGAVAFSVVHVAGMGALRWATYAALGAHYAPLGPLGNFPYEFRKDLLVYAAIVAIYTAWLRLVQPARPPEPSAAPEILEVRDGARRHFIPLAEIDWIEAAGNYVELHRGRTPVLHRASLSEMERDLRDAGYVRIHRSRLVRRDAVVRVESRPSGDYIVGLADGRELAGSRRYRRPLMTSAGPA